MNEYEVLKQPAITNGDHRISSYFSFTLLPKKEINLSNTTYAQPLIEDLNDFRRSNDSNMQFAITKELSFNTILTFFYDSVPQEGVPDVNYQIKNGLTYRF